MPEFQGIKLAADAKAKRRPWGVRKVGVNKNDDRLEILRCGRTGWGGNGGYHALNLAVQMQPEKILLVGYDMSLANGLHWHGPHPAGLNNPLAANVERWRRVMDDAAEQIAALGIRVFNCSPSSALQNYRKLGFEEALNC